MLFCEIYEVFKNVFCYRAPSVGRCFCFHFFIYTYLLILIYTYLSVIYLYLCYMLSLYYYINLIKLIKYGNIETTTKFSRLKSISSIEDNYLEAATGGVLQKKLLLKIRNFLKKTTVLESLFNKVAGLQPCRFTEKRLQHRCFPVHIANFLRTSILKNICERLLLINLLL